MSELRVVHDLGEQSGVKGCAPNQRAINLRLVQQAGDVLWFDAATIENSYVVGEIATESVRERSPDREVRFGRNFRCGGFAGANRPDWFVGDHKRTRVVR